MASYLANVSGAVCLSKLEMNSPILTIFVVLSLFGIYCESSPAYDTRQNLPELPGFIPVYIRTGDTPLADIDEDLAEAFENYAIKHAKFRPLPVITKRIFDQNDEENMNNLKSLNTLDSSQEPRYEESEEKQERGVKLDERETNENAKIVETSEELRKEERNEKDSVENEKKYKFIQKIKLPQ